MLKSELRAEEYRARAQDAFAAAEGATLERVRAQRQRSATTWSQLADAEDARARSHHLALLSTPAPGQRRPAPQPESTR